MKKGTIPILFLFLTLILNGCFSPWQEDKGSFNINLGGPENGRYYYDAPQHVSGLSYTIKVTDGTGPDQIREGIGEDQKSLHFSVEPGQWNIAVEAYKDKEPYAIGSRTITIKPGNNGSVAVEMGLKLYSVTIIDNRNNSDGSASTGGSTGIPSNNNFSATIQIPHNSSLSLWCAWYSDQPKKGIGNNPNINYESLFNLLGNVIEEKLCLLAENEMVWGLEDPVTSNLTLYLSSTNSQGDGTAVPIVLEPWSTELEELTIAIACNGSGVYTYTANVIHEKILWCWDGGFVDTAYFLESCVSDIPEGSELFIIIYVKEGNVSVPYSIPVTITILPMVEAGE